MKFRKKPAVIEAVQWTGDNLPEVTAFCPPLLTETYRANGNLTIPTPEGKVLAHTGDYIIKSRDGEFVPCPPDVSVIRGIGEFL